MITKALNRENGEWRQPQLLRISYCSTDTTHNNVFAFIATSKNETLECHAFLCPHRKMAQAATLTIAQVARQPIQPWKPAVQWSNSISKLASVHQNINPHWPEPADSQCQVWSVSFTSCPQFGRNLKNPLFLFVRKKMAKNVCELIIPS